ncbi:MAG TPA: cadherin domain-containing protein, partial [Burkholderiales bacterium]|nr:cadherin domain-containing protein [Burkholderiales bacterium]
MRSTSIDRPSDALASTLFDNAKADIQAFAHGPALGSAAAAAFDVTGAALADTIESFVRNGWPRLEVVDDQSLGGARGAYDSAHNTIYLSSQFLGTASPGAVTAVLIEEIGHAIDARVNSADSAGDEGEIFARYVTGDTPDAADLAALHAQNDHGTIFVDGGIAEVEFASTSTNGAKVAIVFSQTSQDRYFNPMAYAQLIMTAQTQATMAGVPFDLITESDLANASFSLTQYDAIVFPNFDAVPAGQASAIGDRLLAAEQSGVGIIAATEFMTVNSGGTNWLSTLLGVTQGSGSGQWANSSITVKAVSGDPMMADYTSGEVIRTYAGEWHQTYVASGATLMPLATQTFANGNTYNAVVTTTKNTATVVHFSTESMLGDNNLLWQAIDKVVNSSPATNQVTAGLQMSRGTSLVASRVDMDQAMNPADVSPGDRPGIYDKLVPILQNWKTTYNFVGSYYIDIGNNPPNQTTNWTISGEYYKQILALGNEIGSHSISHPPEVDNLTTAQIQSEFQGSKTIIEQKMTEILGTPFTVEGAAVPGNPEDYDTALDILQYYRYLSGGASTVGAGYPGAIGYLNPAMAAADKVYIAPNIEFDFSLVEFQHMTPAQASAAWLAQWNQLTAHSDVPIVVWPWHDYAAAEWSYDGTTPSLYTTQMFTDFIQRAFNAGAEFVTLADLADRYSSFDDSSLTWTRNSPTQVTATVTSPDAGKFVVDLDNLGSQKIASVNGWYAYDDDSVFLDRDGGSFIINLGSTPDNVTHITALPMRSELVSLSGDGSNLTFQLIGEGDVTIDLASLTGKTLSVSGATIQSQIGEILVLDLGANGTHNVTVTLAASSTNHAPTITSNGGGATATVSVAENTTAVTTVTATDTDAGQTRTFSISGGADAAKFSINATTGVLTFVAAPNFEAPTDVGANNSYVVDVRVTDNGSPVLTDTQTITVNVTNVNEAPAITSNGGGATATVSVAENTTAVTTVTATDVDAGQTRTFSISGGPDAAKFSINATTGAVSFVTAPDFEAPTDVGANNTYVVDVRATDNGSPALFDTQTITVTVTDVAGVNLSGDGGANTLTGTPENDTLTGLGGNDTLRGLGGDDVLNGGAGADVIDGGSGNDTASYAGSDSRVWVRLWVGDNWGGHAAGDQLVSIENLIGSDNADWFEGLRTAASVLDGRGSDDALFGGGFNDTLLGGEGNDWLLGGAGADVLDGGNGIDTASYEGSTGRVWVRLWVGDNWGGDAAGDQLISIENLVGSD